MPLLFARAIAIKTTRHEERRHISLNVTEYRRGFF